MSNAITDGGIYANGRTHAEHCAWLNSLQPDSDEYRIVFMPCGYLFNLADISYLKYALMTAGMTSGERSKILDAIASAVVGPVTWEAIAVIEPCCDTGREILEEIKSLDVDEQYVDTAGVSFDSFIVNESNSAVIRGYVKSWLHRAFRQYDAVRFAQIS
jgi:hypothetical protein